jgi:hypothetical protein
MPRLRSFSKKLLLYTFMTPLESLVKKDWESMSSGCYSKDSARFSSRRASAIKGVDATESTRWRFLVDGSSGLDFLRLLELLRI